MEPMLPGPNSPPFWERTWLIELCSTAAPTLGALTAAAREFWPGLFTKAAASANKTPVSPTGNPAVGWLFIIAAVFLVLGWHLRVRKAKKNNLDGIQTPLDISAFTHTLRSVLLDLNPAANNKDSTWRLRVTVYRPHPRKKDELERCVPYAGGKEDGLGRSFKNNSGVIGRAYQSRKISLAKRESDDHQQFIEEMISEYSIPREEAEALKPGRRAWLAIPITGTKAPVGVVFMDSDDKEFFSEPVIEAAVSATEGIAEYVRKVYRATTEKK